MTNRTIWLFGVGYLLIGVAISAQFVEASEPPISSGDKVVTTAEAPVKVGTKTLATVPKGTELVATAVKGDWIAVAVERDGKNVSGWVDRKYLSPRGQADEPQDRFTALCRAYFGTDMKSCGKVLAYPPGPSGSVSVAEVTLRSPRSGVNTYQVMFQKLVDSDWEILMVRPAKTLGDFRGVWSELEPWNSTGTGPEPKESPTPEKGDGRVPARFRGEWMERVEGTETPHELTVTESRIVWDRTMGGVETHELPQITIAEDGSSVEFTTVVVVAVQGFNGTPAVSARTIASLSLDGDILVASVNGFRETVNSSGIMRWKSGTSLLREVKEGKLQQYAKCPPETIRFTKSAGPDAQVDAAELQIKAARATSYEAKAIGYSKRSAKVVVVELTLEHAADQPTKLDWKNAVPVLEAGAKRVEASRLLIPNWLPAAGNSSTQVALGGEVIKGFLEIDANTWCDWLAINKPGTFFCDHVSIPVKSATVIVTKKKPANIKLLFPEDVQIPGAKIVIPGCKPSPFSLGGSAEGSR